MYLRELFIKNSGPSRELHVNFPFTPDDKPVPVLIVGRNGAGKTNLLSLIADALMEGAANVYHDILKSTGQGRNYFRVVGGTTLTYDETGGFSILRFEHDGKQLIYREHAGELTASEAQQLVPSTLSAGANWPENDQNQKTFPIDEATVRSIYEPGAHIFFPSSRSEVPYWLNEKALSEDTFDQTARFKQNLGKPIFVEHGIDDFAQWILGVLTESRGQLGVVPDPNDPQKPTLGILDGVVYANAQITLQQANTLLRAIMDDPQAYFYWMGRRQPRKVGVASGNKKLASGLDSLSGAKHRCLRFSGQSYVMGTPRVSRPRKSKGSSSSTSLTRTCILTSR
jgi:hypothetical protein